ncbi:MAG TPA: hypothetical protein VFA37_09830 [Gaiellaceae bacterium]|nr:hypothetical protein [Gaiellaceae bacterium]
MPFWGWALLIGLAGLGLVVALAAVVRGAHGLPEREPAHTDVTDLSAPLPRETAEALDEKTEREVEAERERGPVVSRRS